jgi:hypothetical protein
LVKNGNEVGTTSVLSTVTAYGVCVTWLTGDPPLDLRFPLMYLGQADGVLAMYRPELKPEVKDKIKPPPTKPGPVRIPSGQVVLTNALNASKKC